MPNNCKVANVDFVGTIVFAGINGDEFADVPAEFTAFKKLFPQMWMEGEDNK